ncbi:MAG TPA: GNAT family N-acetyltransferase [Candidatus Acidoferrales bacterium]
MNIIDPLIDKRWDDLVARHPRASAFHRRGWLEALKLTYGYEPFVLTSAPAGEALADGIAACRIKSWLTGTRIVSLPFADHCDPLIRDAGEGFELSEGLIEECTKEHCKYLELRPLMESSDLGNKFQGGESFYFHELDLRPGVEQLFKGLHKDSIQRKIRRAEKEQVTYESDSSEQFILTFYNLLLITRRRHHLPPQPINWFRNLAKSMGDALQIRLAKKNGVAIAALLTLRHGKNIIYKYGCSDGAFHQLGGMPFLFWKLIEEGKATGAESLDFGRSEIENEGLVAFKDKFGTVKRKLTYHRYPQTTAKQSAHSWGDSVLARKMFSMLPDGALSAAGKLLYRHIG